MGRQFAAQDVHLSAKPGIWVDPAGVRDFCRGAVSSLSFASAGCSRRADPLHRHSWRSAGRCAIEKFSLQSANKGLVCDVGLWRWSRHPNYFFEWLGWLAYPVIGLSTDYPSGWATLLAPVFMYWILVYVTGIPCSKRRCCALAASAIATTSRAPARSFRCRRKTRPMPSIMKACGLLRVCARPEPQILVVLL
jgi:hypothetical protein